MNRKKFPVFAINLKARADRKKFVSLQFRRKEEFQFNLVEAHQHNIGAIGLWMTIRHILNNLVTPKEEFIILCQDDHLFTEHYSKDHFFGCVDQAQLLNADILSCGISGFTSAIRVNQYIYWVEKFSGLQFTVIFRSFFQRILDADFDNINAADIRLCELTENKFFISPFLSIQKEFGYSDVTAGNNVQGHVDNAFKDCNEKVQIINTVSAFYKQKLKALEKPEKSLNLQSIVIPTYVVSVSQSKEGLWNIENQFDGKGEFAVEIIEACHHKDKTLGFWLAIQKIIHTAIDNDDDVIIICKEEHQFTGHYERSKFMDLVWQAGLLGCNILIGGMDVFNLALPISKNIFWIDSFQSARFFVIYRSFYTKILQEKLCNSDTLLESKFSEMTSSKMVVYPFISRQNYFGNTNTKYQDNFRNTPVLHSTEASERLGKIERVQNTYNYCMV